MSNLTPSIPAVQDVADPVTAKILLAVRERVLYIMGQLPSVPALVPVGPTAMLSDLRNKVNEIVGRLQGSDIVNQKQAAAPANWLTNSLTGDVALNNTALYFDGPSVAQGSVGTWFVSGSVTVIDTASAAAINAKLWDGTTVLDSGNVSTAVALATLVISLSGVIAAPAGNLRISVRDASSGNGKILFNASGNSVDSTITAIRIG